MCKEIDFYLEMCYHVNGDMMKRKIYDKLLNWKNNNDNMKPLMLLGARQVGKTYIIDEFCRNEFENYIHINLFEDTKIVDLYNSNMDSSEKFIQLKVLLNFDIEKENTVLFIDEIQESEKLISELKYFCEKYNNIRIICAGSLLGVKLKRSKFSFPVGKVNMINMYPMDFEEFLMAMDEELLIEEIKKCYSSDKQMAEPVHNKALNLYRLYQITGGMPESVKNMVFVKGDIIKYDTEIINNIIKSYFKDMDKYVVNENEALKIERTYNSIPTQLANESNKFQYSKIQSGARSRDYETAIDWLEASNIVIKSYFVSLPEIPLKGFVKNDVFKIFVNDIGILNNLLEIKAVDILTDNISLYKGSIAENYVANQLIQNNFSLYYWHSEGIAEVDFLIYTNDGIIPIEVKAGDSTQSKSLNVYMEKYNPKYAIRISTRNFGFDKDKKIKSIPLYAVFCIK